MKINKIFSAGTLFGLLFMSVITFPLSANAQGTSESNGQSEIVSAFGKVPGKDLNVHIWVKVPHGADKNKVVTDALAKHGAQLFVSEKFSETGLYWDQFGDSSSVQSLQGSNP